MFQSAVSRIGLVKSFNSDRILDIRNHKKGFVSKMRKIFTVFTIVFLYSVTSSAIAACYSKYDYTTGNNYQVCNNGGSTTIRGNNFSTGSTWSQTQRSNGTYSGTDSSGNYYTGNNNTGSYFNYGTGKTCYGTGALRTCY